MNHEKAKDETFYLGLTMAGAVSAGCYTAGAMDYLFEMLDLWQQMKDGTYKDIYIDPKLVPTHKVIIDVMGGASAGGMATMMSAIYALEGKVNPVKEYTPGHSKQDNILYDSWVYLDDEVKNTFEQLWDTDDIENSGKLTSLFNTKAIDSIAERAYTFKQRENLQEKRRNMAPYISQNLELLLSHSMLHGIPLEVDFNSPIAPEEKTMHTTYEHFMVSHFAFPDLKGNVPAGYMQLNPYDNTSASCMKASTIATGAFPVGLKYRSLDHLNDEYYKQVIKKIVYADFGNPDPDTKNLIDLDNFPNNFKTLTVDGGATNNEPYSQVMSILKTRHAIKPDLCSPDKCLKELKEKESKLEVPIFKNYGLVMIDPFPDRIENAEDYKHPDDLIGVAPQIIQMLWDQSKVKRAEMIADYRNEYRGEICPSRWIGNKKDPYPLACGSVMAFGGFLDVNFRKYDFFLGRDNARNFYRYFFSLPYYENDQEKNHPMHKSPFWTDEARKVFKIEKPVKEGSENKKEEFYYLPIIPDMNMILHKENANTRNRIYTPMDRPAYNPVNLLKLEPAIEHRMAMISKLLKNKLIDVNKSNPSIVADEWIDKYYNNGLINRVKKYFPNLAFRFAMRWISRKVAKLFIRMILVELAKANYLEKPRHKSNT